MNISSNITYTNYESTAKTLKFHHEDTKSRSSLFTYLRSCLRVFVVRFLPFLY